MTALPRGSQQRGFERHIDDVGDNRARRQLREVDVERRLAGHAERGGVDQDPGLTLHGIALAPGMDRDARRRGRQIIRDALDARARAIDDADLLDFHLDQRRNNCAGRAAGAEDDCRPCRGFPIRCPLTQIFAEAEYVGVAAFEAAVDRNDDRVHRTDAASQRIDAVDDRQCRLLVRQCQIAAAKTQRRQRAQSLRQMLRRHRQRHIDAVDAVFVDPEIMQRGRARMGHRPAHDAGQPCPPRDPHRSVLMPIARHGCAETPAAAAMADRERRNGPPSSVRKAARRGLRIDRHPRSRAGHHLRPRYSGRERLR